MIYVGALFLAASALPPTVLEGSLIRIKTIVPWLQASLSDWSDAQLFTRDPFISSRRGRVGASLARMVLIMLLFRVSEVAAASHERITLPSSTVRTGYEPFASDLLGAFILVGLPLLCCCLGCGRGACFQRMWDFPPHLQEMGKLIYASGGNTRWPPTR